MGDIELSFPTHVDFNFDVQNNADETLTITRKEDKLHCGSTKGFKPPGDQAVTSNGENGHFEVTSKYVMD